MSNSKISRMDDNNRVDNPAYRRSWNWGGVIYWAVREGQEHDWLAGRAVITYSGGLFYRALKAFIDASKVCAITSVVWAVDTNPASNCDGAR